MKKHAVQRGSSKAASRRDPALIRQSGRATIRSIDFIDEERHAWHELRRTGNGDADGGDDGIVGVCLHCGNPFGIDAGMLTADAALCDLCNGD